VIQAIYDESHVSYERRDMVSLTDANENAILGEWKVPMSRECNEKSGFCTARWTNREKRSVEFCFEGNCAAGYGTSFTEGGESWSNQYEDVVHMINPTCVDCVGTFDRPWWRNETHRRKGTWRPNPTVSSWSAPQPAAVDYRDGTGWWDPATFGDGRDKYGAGPWDPLSTQPRMSIYGDTGALHDTEAETLL
jgi:hypothetical protein